LFVNGELVGGCDIIEEMSNNGSLLPLLKAAAPKKAETAKETLSTVILNRLCNKAFLMQKC